MTNVPRLTRYQLGELAAELRGELARVERTIARESERDDLAPAEHPPPVSDGALAVASPSRARERRDALLDAIARLESGSYGTCLRCTRPIPFGRLLVMPEASCCAGCG